MRDEKINLDDPLFLVSRGMDGDLSVVEQVRLDRMLEASLELRVEANKFKAVAQLVHSRRNDIVHVDWKLHEKLILTAIDEAESDLTEVDSLLQKWGQKKPHYSEDALTDGVMTRISPAHERKQSAWRIVARLGAPLAAAAAVALVVTATWFTPAMKPVSVVVIGPMQQNRESDAPVTIVSFARTVDRSVSADEPLSFGSMTLGSSPIGQAREEAPL